MGQLVSALFRTQDLKADVPPSSSQICIGIIGILCLVGVAVFSPAWYILRIQPFDSNYQDNPSCEIQAFDWVQLGMKNGPVNLQYDHAKISGVLDKCEDGTEFDWVLWTVEDARVIMWGSGATGVWTQLNTGAKSHNGGAISFVGIWCVNDFVHELPLQVLISPMSNSLEARDVTFAQDTADGRVECTVDAATLADFAIESVRGVHSSGDFCKSVASKIPVVCRTFDWAGCMAFMLSSWGFVTSVFSFLMKRTVVVDTTAMHTKPGDA